jgi:DNA-binding PadR family transcriptional regulator
MRDEYSKWLPMGPAALHILLALAAEPLHGYGIMQEIARQSDGKYKIGPGTLYDNLKKLMNDGLVEESGRGASVPAKTVGGAGEQEKRPTLKNRGWGTRLVGRRGERVKRYYRLSGFGRGVLAAEVTRLQGVVREASARLRGLKPKRV